MPAGVRLGFAVRGVRMALLQKTSPSGLVRTGRALMLWRATTLDVNHYTTTTGKPKKTIAI